MCIVEKLCASSLCNVQFYDFHIPENEELSHENKLLEEELARLESEPVGKILCREILRTSNCLFLNVSVSKIIANGWVLLRTCVNILENRSYKLFRAKTLATGEAPSL